MLETFLENVSVLGDSIKGNEPSIIQIFIKQRFQASKLMNLNKDFLLLEEELK